MRICFISSKITIEPVNTVPYWFDFPQVFLRPVTQFEAEPSIFPPIPLIPFQIQIQEAQAQAALSHDRSPSKPHLAAFGYQTKNNWLG